MDLLISTIFILTASALIYLRWWTGTKRDFNPFFKQQLAKFGLTLMTSEYPGLFKVGPFKKFEIEFGKPQINGGVIRYERTYYRKIKAKMKNGNEIEIWAKIETGWFKETTVEYIPKLKRNIW